MSLSSLFHRTSPGSNGVRYFQLDCSLYLQPRVGGMIFGFSREEKDLKKGPKSLTKVGVGDCTYIGGFIPPLWFGIEKVFTFVLSHWAVAGKVL